MPTINLFKFLGTVLMMAVATALWAAEDNLQPLSENLGGSRLVSYPLTWEIRASQANCAGMKVIDPVFVEQETAAPHTWHAAEIFLYLLDPVATNASKTPDLKKP